MIKYEPDLAELIDRGVCKLPYWVEPEAFIAEYRSSSPAEIFTALSAMCDRNVGPRFLLEWYEAKVFTAETLRAVLPGICRRLSTLSRPSAANSGSSCSEPRDVA